MPIYKVKFFDFTSNAELSTIQKNHPGKTFKIKTGIYEVVMLKCNCDLRLFIITVITMTCNDGSYDWG